MIKCKCEVQKSVLLLRVLTNKKRMESIMSSQLDWLSISSVESCQLSTR
uniref:Uncharacterized protein n=1 Tax=Meloidogyne enterolobii TaxID=390850 RepID=A0A6V7TRB4_MELEN|nr:unnamed protein product [Meloidogyne enterolobii]